MLKLDVLMLQELRVEGHRDGLGNGKQGELQAGRQGERTCRTTEERGMESSQVD